MKIFSSEFIPRDLLEQIKKEKFAYHSNEWDLFFMSEKVFNILNDKYAIATAKNEDDEDIIEYYFNSIQEMISCMYEQVTVKFFDRNYYLRDVAELVEEEIEFRTNEDTGEITIFVNDDWKDDLKRITMERLTIIIRSDLEDELYKLMSEGGVFNTMKEAIESIEINNKMN
jgi:hypothetical protein